MHKTNPTVAIVAAFALAGCAPLPPGLQGYLPNSADTYTPGQTQNVQRVLLGTVLAVRHVEIQPAANSRMLASGAGALIGGLLGHQIGGGKARTLATVAGAVGGAIGGNMVDSHVQRRPGLQVTVRLNNGNVINVTQAADVHVTAGQGVQVIGGGYGNQPVRIEALTR